MSYTYENKYYEMDIMEPTKRKDIVAFDYLYDTYAPALYGVIFRLIPEEKIANNILKESFIKFWRELDSYKPLKGRYFSLMLSITIQECKAMLDITNSGFPHPVVTPEQLAN